MVGFHKIGAVVVAVAIMTVAVVPARANAGSAAAAAVRSAVNDARQAAQRNQSNARRSDYVIQRDGR